jgi:hypothetical protein
MSFSKRLLSSAPAAFVASENFNVVTYTGDGTTSKAITGVGFQPDFIWIKERSGVGSGPLADSTRGTGKAIYSNLPDADYTFTSGEGIKSFDSDGFTVGDISNGNAGYNGDGDTYVAWCWKANGGTTSSNTDGSITSTVQANKNAGFSIVKYTGSGSSASVGHGLASAPKLILSKRIASSSDWLAGAIDWTKYLEPNGTPPFRTANVWTNSAPTSTTFGVINSTSASSVEYINYCWADVAGYQKIDSYEGNGSTNGPFVNVGFEPAYVMVKNVDSTDNWLVFDNARNTVNPRTQLLQWNLNAAESAEAGAQMNFYSNGFQSVGAGGGAGSGQINSSGDTYLYLAIAANPDEESPTLSSSFNMRTYTGSELTRSITGAGFAPNWIWIKERTSTSNHVVFDTMRGADNQLYITTTGAESENNATISSFDSDGWTMDNGLAINDDTEDYISWLWKADDNEPTINTNGSTTSTTSVNSNAGFSIVSFTGTGSNATVGHGLSQAPDWIIFKNRDASTSWLVYHQGLGNEKALYLESTSSPTDSASFFQDTDPTSTVFSVGVHSDPNGNTHRIIAYCFHDVAGYSKFGSYTGNGSAGQAITTGFKPDFILIRSTVGTDNWRLYDTRRGIKEGGYLEPNRSDTDDTSNAPSLTITSTGFTITAGGVTNGDNANGNLYLYMAFAKNVPMNTTLAKSFGIATWTGNDNNTRAITGLGFRPDFVWIKRRNSSEPHALYDSLRGENKQLESNSNGAQAINSTQYMGLPSFDADGFSVGNNGGTNRASNTYVGWAWKAGNTWESNIDGTIESLVNANTANGFSIVKYTATGGSVKTVGHGLSSAPELIIAKVTNQSYDWLVYHSSLGNDVGLQLHSNAAAADNSFMDDTSPTSSVFTVKNGNNLNYADGNEIIAYCWHSVSGFSKFGSYTGNSSTQSITGVGFQPDWLMIKQTNATNSWRIFDSTRGLTSPQTLFADLNSQEDSESNTVSSFDSDGFTMGSQQGVNDNGDTYIYMAFKAN